MTSVAGVVAGPGWGAYACSKYALEAFADALRREMGAWTPWRLSVSIVEPAFMRTPMATRELSRTASAEWDALDHAVRGRWGLPWFEERLQTKAASMAGLLDEPAVVVDAYMHAITAVHPHIRYHPGKLSKLIYILSLLPAPLADAVFALRSKTLPAHFTR